MRQKHASSILDENFSSLAFSLIKTRKPVETLFHRRPNLSSSWGGTMLDFDSLLERTDEGQEPIQI
ncbi:hypothetical protein E2N92_06320 [Methanofollis formosanus]|uniref:Uncharacterized protein n=1 Tax=Methanofollis formosanus TaxID=299308 RepID=A0A8G1A114_9EURY|nr:hypothetical protein [Methanofollis formosanus]QYZ79070.1 hypothetical protein E2N92_06320 [Methanofollis formosanus]